VRSSPRLDLVDQYPVARPLPGKVSATHPDGQLGAEESPRRTGLKPAQVLDDRADYRL
jgi:hypothetical protein